MNTSVKQRPISVFGRSIPPMLIDSVIRNILARDRFLSHEIQLLIDAEIAALPDDPFEDLKAAARTDPRFVYRVADRFLQRLRKGGFISRGTGKWLVKKL